MIRPRVLRVLLLNLLVTVGLSTQPLFAGPHGGGGGFHGGGGGQHGGGGFHGGGGGGFHGGGGGWHGGGGGWSGGGSGWHGGGGWNGGGWHGGGYGWHGGYGWRGGYYGGWGYPGYWGGGWGFSIGFNFGGPWGYYGYPYAGYYPYYYPYNPYPYYYYAPVNTSASYSVNADYPQPGSEDPYNPPASQSGPVPYNAPAGQPGSATVPHFAPNSSGVNLQEASYGPPAARYRSTPATVKVASYRPASSASGRQLPPMSPRVQNVIRALHGMPPAARQRQIDSGRYSNLSPQELQQVKYAVDLP